MLTRHPAVSSRDSHQKPHRLRRLLLVLALAGLTVTFSLLWLGQAPPGRAAAPAAGAPPGLLTIDEMLRPGQELTPTTCLDVVVVMDVSGSTELDTTCTDCWRARPISQLRDDQLFYPDTGDFNPIPFDPNHPDVPRDGDGRAIGQSIPESYLCTQPPLSYRPVKTVDTSTGGPYHYLVHEAELYSANSSNWTIESRQPGKGVWVVQRGTKNGDHGNQAGTISRQSSNVCNPGIFGDGLDCTLGGAFPNTICTSVDCSAYVQARPFTTYQGAEHPFLNGASFNADCFSGDGGASATGQCWNGQYENRGGPAPSGPDNIPVLEYDFTPDWDGLTTIWIRAQGGGLQAFRWGGYYPQREDCPSGGDTRDCMEANWGYQDNVYWQVVQADGTPWVITENNHTRALGANNRYDWRDNRAVYNEWAWVRLGSVDVPKNQQHTLRIYQGSTGYKLDKIVFTNNPNGSSGSPPVVLTQNSSLGPKVTDGSATREACNVCNPLYGCTVDSSDCSCWKQPWDTGQGAGTGCTSLLPGTTGYSSLNDDLYKGLQPLRGSQESIKRLAMKLDPGFDQVGFVAFESSVVSARSKLRCLRRSGTACFTDTDPITAYEEVLRAIENQVPLGGTNIAAGLDEALEELGIKTHTNGYRDSACSTTQNDGKACDRFGLAPRVIILLTDGIPSGSPNCTTAPDFVDMWDNPDYGTEDRDYECAMYYAYKAAANDVTIYTIGLGGGVETDILAAIATGVDPRGNGPAAEPVFNGTGKFYPAANPNLLDGIFNDILAGAPACHMSSWQPRIWSLNGYTKKQGDELRVRLDNHPPEDAVGRPAAYDVYLEDLTGAKFRICSNIQPDLQAQADAACFVDYGIPAGTYELYSTLFDRPERAAPPAPEFVVVETPIPAIVIRDPGTQQAHSTWTVSSTVEVALLGHQPADEPFEVGLYHNGTLLEQIAAHVPALDGPQPTSLAWTVPDVPDCAPGGMPCSIQSRAMSDTGTIYAQAGITITQPAPVSFTLTKTDTPDPVTPGALLTYTISVRNDGAGAAFDTVITDTLDERTGFVWASDGGQHWQGVVTWTAGVLDAGQTITRLLRVRVGQVVSGTVLSNTAWVSAPHGIYAGQSATTTVVEPPEDKKSMYLPLILKN